MPRLLPADRALEKLPGLIRARVCAFAIAMKPPRAHKYNALRSLSIGNDVAVSSTGLQGVKVAVDRKSTRLNSSHSGESRMPSSA